MDDPHVESNDLILLILKNNSISIFNILMIQLMKHRNIYVEILFQIVEILYFDNVKIAYWILLTSDSQSSKLCVY